MLHILDARTGEPVSAAPARRGLTRIEAHASGLDPTALRVLLTADLLVRALELGGTPVWTILTAPREQPELRTAATRLAIRPFEDGRDLASGLGEAQVIHVAGGDAAVLRAEGPVAAVAPAAWAGPEPPLPALLGDPAALRLALLSARRQDSARLDGTVLTEAAGQLARWRGAVAGWARRPSRPVPEEVRTRLRTAWEDDLDLPGVLEVLRDVERDPDLPDGARFETYAYADRLLALDLTRDVGSLT
ncbi:hypothetical protein JK359_13390 [Streptomyces actinomycinicus]|uniref:Cysteinyl-tRNA synthetase n=1 Tax=Streptomyces actinomycinicus TaxID=1695166 RepID=A0A937EJ42_9ACTN|nr:hypothetical protein [Streptomyces actinomycinicus]MBL1082964.1 hypothetical protein [Streptomyces actinomycinicus]